MIVEVVSPGSTRNSDPDISEPRPTPIHPPTARPSAARMPDPEEDERRDVRALGAEGDPDAELARALARRVGRHAEHADAGEHQRHRRERATRPAVNRGTARLLS